METNVPTLSTGDPSTLGNWYKLTEALFGKQSPATWFIEDKIKEQGESEPVITDEGQLLHALGQMHFAPCKHPRIYADEPRDFGGAYYRCRHDGCAEVIGDPYDWEAEHDKEWDWWQNGH